MAGKSKMARLLLLFLRMLHINAHREGNDLKSADISSSSESSSDMDTREHARRSLYVKDREWQYEGIPIDFPSRRSGNGSDGQPEAETTTPTTTTTMILPPMNRRFRRIYSPDENTSVDEHPYIAALLVNKELWCGAVVLERDRVLTAAHCLQLQYNNRFFREYVKMLNVRVGSSNATAGGEILRVTEITFHPNYKPDTLDFNAAVLRLHKNITFGKRESYVDKIDYSRERTIPIDNNVTFLGWGSVLGSGGLGGQVLLQKVELPVYDLADCQGVYGRDLVTRTNFCAGFITVAKNVCNHDAGGPAVMDGKLVGILSFSSKRCDTPDQPAVFTTLGALAPWLESTVEKRAVDDTTPNMDEDAQ